MAAETITADNRSWLQKLVDKIRNSSTVQQYEFARDQVTNNPPNYSTMPIVQPMDAAKAASQAKYPNLQVSSATSNTNANSGGGTRTVAPVVPDNTIDLNKNAEDQKNANMRAIISRLNMMKDEANRLKGSARETYDFNQSQLGTMFEGLNKLSTEKRASSLNTLGQEDIGVQNLYGREQGNARRAMESATRRNRMLNRAQGSLGSSFYNDAQADTTNQGLNTVNDLGIEQAGKRAGIKERISGVNTEFDQTDLQLGQEKKSLEQEALTRYNEAVAAADLMEKGYGIDSEEQLQNAETEFKSNLAKIQDYVQTKQLKQMELNALYGNSGTSALSARAISSYNPVNDTLSNKLANDTAMTKAGNTIASLTNVSQPTATTTDTAALTQSQLAKIKKQLEDTTGYYINNPYTA